MIMDTNQESTGELRQLLARGEITREEFKRKRKAIRERGNKTNHLDLNQVAERKEIEQDGLSSDQLSTTSVTPETAEYTPSDDSDQNQDTSYSEEIAQINFEYKKEEALESTVKQDVILPAERTTVEQDRVAEEKKSKPSAKPKESLVSRQKEPTVAQREPQPVVQRVEKITPQGFRIKPTWIIGIILLIGVPAAWLIFKGDPPKTENGGADKGVLIVKMTPSAEAIIDGWQAKSGPRVKFELSPGSHKLLVQKKGYYSKKANMTVVAGKTIEKIIRLRSRK